MAFENPFLKATPLYKEYAILELLSKDSNVSQRTISKNLDSSLSMVNQYLDEYENRDLIKREYINSKSVEYALTKKGMLRLKELNFKYLESIRNIYLDAKALVVKFLHQIVDNGFKTILMYGAGEVAELTLQVLNEEVDLPLKVLAVIDDDIKKQNKDIMGYRVISRNEIDKFDVEGILVSSFGYSNLIKGHLKEINYDLGKVFDFFE